MSMPSVAKTEIDYSVPKFEVKYLENYEWLNPFTAEFIKRFGLDDRLFRPRLH